MIADELEDDEVSAKCADSKDDSISRTNAAGPSVRTLCPAPPRPAPPVRFFRSGLPEYRPTQKRMHRRTT